MKNKKIYLDKTREIVKNPNLQVIVLVIFVIANTLMISNLLNYNKIQGCFFCSNEFASSEGWQTFANLQIKNSQFRALDGVAIKGSQATSTRPLAVIIENHFEARPQAGITSANLIYEFLTEGGITRFLAFYDASATVEKIGPVRSCRPYFLNTAEEFQALFSHVGGSPACLDLLKNFRYDVYNLDEYSKTNYFWRSQNQLAPHNVYTSSELMNKYLVEKDIDIQKEFETWQFKNDSPITSSTASFEDEQALTHLRVATKIKVNFSTYTYNVEWHYNEKNNEYARYVTGELHQDSSGQTIKAKNIVVQYVKARLLDSIGRLSLKMEGRGDALIFQDGQVIEGYWKKSDRASRTKFYSEDGEEIAFNRGTTWVEVVPTDREVSWE